MRIAARSIAGLALGLLFSAGAAAQAPAARESIRAKYDRMDRMQEHIRQVVNRAVMLKPVRRDSPLRYLNISDDEVREIQGVVREYIPRDMVNISPVIDGCVCEEGPSCSAQVYVVAMNGDFSRGIQLSRVGKAWRIGAIQQWWLEYERLQPRLVALAYEDELELAYDLANRFPSCAPKSGAEQVVSSNEGVKTAQ